MYVSSLCIPTANKATSPPLVIGIILNHDRPPQHTQYVFQQDVFFHHFLMSVCGHANILSLRLKGKALSDCIDVSRIHIGHDFKRLLCIRNAFKIFLQAQQKTEKGPMNFECIIFHP
jgi:hypothetical protein